MGDSPRDDEESNKQVVIRAYEAVEDVEVKERCGCCQCADENQGEER
jgi:hypothetical protein